MMNLITKQDAAGRGLTRYFTGRPCSRGHVSERLTNGGACVQCMSENKKARAKTRAYKDQRNAQLIEKRAAVRPQTLARIEVNHAAVVERNAAQALGVKQRREERKRIREAKRQAGHDEREAKKQAARDAKTKIKNEKRERREAALLATREKKCYHGDPCSQGHTLRYRSNNQCVDCSREWRRGWETKARRDKDSVRHATEILRARLRAALRGDFKSGSAVRDLGCTIGEFKDYVEMIFMPGMTWDNWSFHGWHLDHVRPLASFDLTDRAEFLKAMHWTNYQPLWADDHAIKTNKERRT